MIAPVRIEMMLKLIAKFEKPPMLRYSSWAYPKRCRSRTSC